MCGELPEQEGGGLSTPGSQLLPPCSLGRIFLAPSSLRPPIPVLAPPSFPRPQPLVDVIPWLLGRGGEHGVLGRWGVGSRWRVCICREEM